MTAGILAQLEPAARQVLALPAAQLALLSPLVAMAAAAVRASTMPRVSALLAATAEMAETTAMVVLVALVARELTLAGQRRVASAAQAV